jgi:hypothetical protein
MPALAVVRRRLEAQGFLGLDDVALAEIGPWLRWSPALCAVFMATGTILASPPVLWALAVTALLGAILPAHPFDIFYNHVVRQLTGTRPLPHHGPQRRFACGIAAAWLIGTALAFHQRSGGARVRARRHADHRRWDRQHDALLHPFSRLQHAAPAAADRQRVRRSPRMTERAPVGAPRPAHLLSEGAPRLPARAEP